MSHLYKLQLSTMQALERFVADVTSDEHQAMISSLPTRYERELHDWAVVEACKILEGFTLSTYPINEGHGEVLDYREMTHRQLDAGGLLKLAHDINHMIHMYRSAIAGLEPGVKVSFKKGGGV